MNSVRTYLSPIGVLTLTADETGLTGLYMEEWRNHPAENSCIPDDARTGILNKTCSWLDRYFAGEKPLPEELPLHLTGSAFARKVWEELLKIPYGELRTYGEVKKILEEKYGKRAAAQAVGGAVGRNPIGIIVPCHRVIGANGNLTGYGGGMERKIWLLEHEGHDMSLFAIPK